MRSPVPGTGERAIRALRLFRGGSGLLGLVEHHGHGLPGEDAVAHDVDVAVLDDGVAELLEVFLVLAGELHDLHVELLLGDFELLADGEAGEDDEVTCAALGLGGEVVGHVGDALVDGFGGHALLLEVAADLGFLGGALLIEDDFGDVEFLAFEHAVEKLAFGLRTGGLGLVAAGLLADHLVEGFEVAEADLGGEFLIELGEDPEREGLKKTPMRVAKSLSFLTQGYRQKVKTVVNGAYFTSGTNHMVILKDIELYSMCEHHMLPFYGKCAIGYISKGKVLGISKLARIVDMFARRLQIQERMTEEIANAIMAEAKADGVGVVIKAKHLCMMMRGVEKQNSEMTTSAVLGTFRSDERVRQEFLSLIG